MTKKNTGSYRELLSARVSPPAIELVNNIARSDKRRGWRDFWHDGNRPRIQASRRAKRLLWLDRWARFRDMGVEG